MTGRINNLSGKAFGPLTVISQNLKEHDYQGRPSWYCQCECGKIEVRGGTELISGRTPQKCRHEKKQMHIERVTTDRIKEVLDLVEESKDIFDALKQKRMSANVFFAALKLNPELAGFYNEQRKYAIEAFLEDSISLVRNAEDKLELKKAEIELEYFKWKAEKLIPEVYGAKVQIDVHKTIDIRGALDEAESRAKDYINTVFRKVEEPVQVLLPTEPVTHEIEPITQEINPEDLLG